MPGAIDATLALVSLADMKEYVKVTGTTEDSILSFLVNEVSRATNSFTGRHLLQKTHTEHYDGDGSAELILRNSPVQALTTVHDDFDRVFGANTLIPAGDIMLEPEAGIIRLWNNTRAFLKGRGNIKVVYDAGYLLASVPQDIQLAVKRWAASQYMKYVHRRHDIQSETTRDQQFTAVIADMPEDVRKLLLPYRIAPSPERAF